MRRLLPDPARTGRRRPGRRLPGAGRPAPAGQLHRRRWTARSPSTGAAGGSAPPVTGGSSRCCGRWPTSCWSGTGRRRPRGTGRSPRTPPSGGCGPSIGRPPTAPIAVVSRRASLRSDEPAGHRRRHPDASWSPARRRTPTAGRRWPRPACACWSAGTTRSTCRWRSTGWPSSGHEQRAVRGRPDAVPDALTAGVVDELDLSIAPALVGGEHRLLERRCGDVVRLDLRQVLEEDGVLFTRYAVDAPGGPVARRPAPGRARPASPRR